MPFEQLTLPTIDKVKGGLVSAMLAKALNRIAVDIETAPDISEWRKVQLLIRAKPILDQGQLDDVSVEFEIGTGIPKRVTSCIMDVRSDAEGVRGLFYQVDAQDNPAQRSLLDQGGDDLGDLVVELRRAGRDALADELQAQIDFVDSSDSTVPVDWHGRQGAQAEPEPGGESDDENTAAADS